MFAKTDTGRRECSRLGSAALLAFDAFATTCGLYAALRIGMHEEEPGHLLAVLRTALPALLAIRLGVAAAASLHRWEFRRLRNLDTARLLLASFAATVAFALVLRGLPPDVYLVECFITTHLMAALRLAPAVIDEHTRERLPEAEAEFVAFERPRRALNVLVALAGLVLTLPVWAAIAIAIKLTSRGPVFYKQERVGLDLRSSRGGAQDPRRKRDLGGRPFMMYKFRTMRVDAETGTGAVWSGKDDPRVTRIGRFLRHCRLDELPQLLNVLRGDMNVVGPRPERASIFAELRQQIPDYTVRQRARPGITGYAQVNLEYDATVEDVVNKLRYDSEYVRHQSVAMDLQIMVKTLPVMLFRERMLSASLRRSGPLVPEKSGS